MTTITVFDYTSNDGDMAIFVGNNFIKCGDDYHDKINAWLEGYLQGFLYNRIDDFNTIHYTVLNAHGLYLHDYDLRGQTPKSLIAELEIDGWIVIKNGRA